MKKKSIKQYIAWGIIGCGSMGIQSGIPCQWILYGFGMTKTISGLRRLRELRRDFMIDITKDWKPNETIIKPLIAYKFNSTNKRYYINKCFLEWLRRKYSGYQKNKLGDIMSKAIKENKVSPEEIDILLKAVGLGLVKPKIDNDADNYNYKNYPLGSSNCSWWELVYCNNITFDVAGWKVVIFNDCGEWDYVDSVTSPDGRYSAYDDIYCSEGLRDEVEKEKELDRLDKKMISAFMSAKQKGKNEKTKKT